MKKTPLSHDSIIEQIKYTALFLSFALFSLFLSFCLVKKASSGEVSYAYAGILIVCTLIFLVIIVWSFIVCKKEKSRLNKLFCDSEVNVEYSGAKSRYSDKDRPPFLISPNYVFNLKSAPIGIMTLSEIRSVEKFNINYRVNYVPVIKDQYAKIDFKNDIVWKAKSTTTQLQQMQDDYAFYIRIAQRDKNA